MIMMIMMMMILMMRQTAPHNAMKKATILMKMTMIMLITKKNLTKQIKNKKRMELVTI